MSDLPDDFAADQLEVEGDLEATLTFNGKDYPCTLGVLSHRSEVEGLVGVRTAIDQVAVVRTELFNDAADRPALRDTVTIDAATYRVMRVETDPTDTALTLYLNEEDA